MVLIMDLPLTDRLSSLVKGLLTDVVHAALTASAELPRIKLLWWRLRRLNTKFATIMAHYHAGTLPPPAPPTPPDPSSPAPASPTPRPPHRVGWVIRKILGASVWAQQLAEMLTDPKLPPAFAAAPQLGSILRPMCRMMAVKQPSWLRLPRRPRPPRPRVKQQHPPAPEWLVNSPGPNANPTWLPAVSPRPQPRPPANPGRS